MSKEFEFTKCYLTDDRWALIASHVPGKEGDPGCRGRDNRLFIEAVFWIARTGSSWRRLPPHFGKWHTNYIRFWRWTQKRVWPGLLSALAEDETCEFFYEDGAIRYAPLGRLVKQEELAVVGVKRQCKSLAMAPKRAAKIRRGEGAQALLSSIGKQLEGAEVRTECAEAAQRETTILRFRRMSILCTQCGVGPDKPFDRDGTRWIRCPVCGQKSRVSNVQCDMIEQHINRAMNRPSDPPRSHKWIVPATVSKSSPKPGTLSAVNDMARAVLDA